MIVNIKINLVLLKKEKKRWEIGVIFNFLLIVEDLAVFYYLRYISFKSSPIILLVCGIIFPCLDK